MGAVRQPVSGFMMPFDKSSHGAEVADVTEFVDLLAHNFALPPINMASSSLVSRHGRGNLFEKPRANMVITVHGVSHQDVLPRNLPFLHSLSSNGGSMLRDSCDILSPECLLQSMFSGFPAEDESEVDHFADLLSQTYDHQPMILSVSANKKLAKAGCGAAQSDKKMSFSMDDETGLVHSTASSRVKRDILRESAQADIDRLMASGTLWQELATQEGDKFSVDTSKNVLTVVDKDGTSVEFDLNDKAVIKLFSELWLVRHLTASLESSTTLAALVKDEIPDLLTFTFSGVQAILEQFGKDSVQYQVALRLVDAAVNQLVSKTSKLYDNKLAGQVVLLNTNQPDVVPVAADDNLMFISMSESLKDDAPQRVEAPARRLDAATDPTQNDIELFQICQWTAILLAIIVFSALYSVAFMDNGRDSLLYAKFQPDVDKKHL
eukprot:GILK01000411.1.p1 GENE.GILK01000411.1~~GILK01000411.1.p1  ORF type:complete len:472 (+),score=92.20 GILK01000411.1:110-1417(+)